MLIKEAGKTISLGYITDYLERNARSWPDKLAIEFEGLTITWGELWRQTQLKSSFFIDRLGADQQKIVALLLTNSIEFVVTYLAALHAGHMVLPLDPAYKKMELDAILERMRPSILVTSTRYIDKTNHEITETVLAEDIQSASTDKLPLRLTPQAQIASLTFTSGTSGRPKAVPNTHANHAWNIKVCSQIWEWTESDSQLLNLPFSHWYGLAIGLSGAIYHGNSIYLRQQSFEAEEVLSLLASGKISMFHHTPLAYTQMLEVDEAKDYDLSKVRVCISGSAPLAPSLWKDFKDRFGVEIVETYGSSETGRIAGNRLGDKVLGSPGPAMPEVRLKLSGDNELLVKSPGLFPGYYKNPEATKEALRPDGYWRTGDIAEIKNGNVFLKGRVQERIRRFSYTISPRDIEWALRQNPSVKDVFVLGQQISGQANDRLIYFIVSDLTEEELRDYCKANLLFAWRPDEVIYLDRLPRTRTGKISLAELKKKAAA